MKKLGKKVRKYIYKIGDWPSGSRRYIIKPRAAKQLDKTILKSEQMEKCVFEGYESRPYIMQHEDQRVSAVML